MFLKSRKAMAAATLTLVLPLSAMTASVVRRRTNAATQSVEFTLRSIDGTTISSESLRGEVVVLAFGAS